MLEERSKFGRYVLLEELGRGAMGSAFLALDSKAPSPEPIVIKRLHEAHTAEGPVVKRFKHEAELALSIRSPYVAKVLDVGRVGEARYIAYEYIEGWSLGRLIDSLRGLGRPPGLNAALRIGVDILRGLEALHTATDRFGDTLGVVHRDLSPSNVMIGTDGRARIIDLGIGKSSRQDWRTSTGVLLGTPGYMSPEQIMGEPADHRTDLYALGSCLYELLVLEPYISPGPMMEMLKASVAPKWRPIHERYSHVPLSLETVLRRALEIEPANRFQSASDFLAVLDGVGLLGQETEAKQLINTALWSEHSEAQVGLERTIAQTLKETVSSSSLRASTDAAPRRRARFGFFSIVLVGALALFAFALSQLRSPTGAKDPASVSSARKAAPTAVPSVPKQANKPPNKPSAIPSLRPSRGPSRGPADKGADKRVNKRANRPKTSPPSKRAVKARVPPSLSPAADRTVDGSSPEAPSVERWSAQALFERCRALTKRKVNPDDKQALQKICVQLNNLVPHDGRLGKVGARVQERLQPLARALREYEKEL